MITTRRGFLSSLLALPVLAKLAPQTFRGWDWGFGESTTLYVVKMPDGVRLLRKNMIVTFPTFPGLRGLHDSGTSAAKILGIDRETRTITIGEP